MKILCTVLATTVLLFSNIVHARVTSLSVAVDGMACPFCAFGVEKRLKTVEGVTSVTVDMKTGTATVAAATDASIRFQDVPQAIKDAGFTAGDIKITVSGRINTNKAGNLVLRFAEFSLVLQTKDNTLKAQLNTAADKGEPVIVKGRIFLNRDKEWVLTPETVKVKGP
jgi:mercuric ion binding protein